MYPEILKEHIKKQNKLLKNLLAFILPLIHTQIEKHIDIILKEKVKIVFTSAVNP